MKVKGYYNIYNKTFLGPVTATAENGVTFTPRYVEGVCFGEYDTDTDDFVPQTNPFIIPKGSVMEIDENPVTGKITVTGIEEDKGLDLVSKGSVKNIMIRGRITPNVTTALTDENGVVIKKIDQGTVTFSDKLEETQVPAKSKIKIDEEPKKIKFNMDDLF